MGTSVAYTHTKIDNGTKKERSSYTSIYDIAYRMRKRREKEVSSKMSKKKIIHKRTCTYKQTKTYLCFSRSIPLFFLYFILQITLMRADLLCLSSV